MRLIGAVEAELRELGKIQKGLPPSDYRKKIDDRIHELYCKLGQLKKEEKMGYVPPSKTETYKCEFCGVEIMEANRKKHLKRSAYCGTEHLNKYNPDGTERF